MTATAAAPTTAPLARSIAQAVIAGSLVFAVARHGGRPAVPDVGWLSQMATEMLDGARLFVDIADTNPPMSVLIYLPIAALHRMIGGPFGLAVLLPVLTLWAAMTSGAVWLLRYRQAGPPAATLWAVSALVFLVLSAGVFGQREHMAAMLLLPLVAGMTLRAEHRQPLWPAVVGIGLAAGLAVTIKPHFALVVALPALAATAAARRWTILLAPEALIAAGLLLAYGAATVVWFPAFGEIWLPILLDTYRQVSVPLDALLATPVVTTAMIAVAAAGLLAATATRADRFDAVMTAAALGFLLAAIEQSKGWSNHFYPATALALFALMAIAANETRRLRWLSAVLAVATVTAMTLPGALQRPQDTMDLAKAITMEAPPRPRLLVLSGAVAVGNPLAMEIGAHWVGSSFGPWVSEFARHRLATETLDPATNARLRTLDAEDRARFRNDLITGDPDVILIDRGYEDWLAWARQDPAVAAALAGYHKRAEAVAVELWVKRAP